MRARICWTLAVRDCDGAQSDLITHRLDATPLEPFARTARGRWFEDCDSASVVICGSRFVADYDSASCEIKLHRLGTDQHWSFLAPLEKGRVELCIVEV